ncbi:MAG TPA: class I SAM-dependent methyltransferase [Candidatus Binataceae bacterium]|nr:class I SAM-dependent methyltransferase [Candidatus Binataceae bacterium]
MVAGQAQQLLRRTTHHAGWRYLDVGCGVGAAARQIAGATDLDVTGVDVDPKQIEASKAGAAHPNLHFIVMDATKLDFSDGEFDIVAASMATHHIPDWERVLSEMVRVLRNGGYLIYTDFVFPGWLAKSGQFLIPIMGFPSMPALESLAARKGLFKIHESRRLVRTDLIWTKKA